MLTIAGGLLVLRGPMALSTSDVNVSHTDTDRVAVCSAKKRSEPGRCQNPVAEPGLRCYLHGGGRSTRPSSKRRSKPQISSTHAYKPERADASTPERIPQQRWSSQPARPEPPRETIRVPPNAAKIAQEVATDGWKASVAGQLSDALNDPVWKSLPLRKRRQLPDCRRLADLADAMEAAKKKAHDAIGAMADRALTLLGRPQPERAIAEAFAKKIPLPGEESIGSVVHGLRIVGVYICASVGKNLLYECRCFRALAKERTGEELKAALTEKLDDLERQFSPPT